MYITENFIPLNVKGNPKEYIDSLKEQNPDIIVAYDNRNDIICVEPTCDYLCLANYYDFLNSVRDKWVSYGYLDLGLVPVFMMPSFMGSMEDQLEEINSTFGSQCYIMRPVSFLKNSYIGPNDVWVKREDFAKYISRYLGQEIPPEKANPSLWLRALYNTKKGGK